MPQPMVRRLLTLLSLLALLAAAGCGGDDEPSGDGESGGDGGADTAAQEEGLKDTTQKPVLPKPTGSPPRRLVVEDIVKGKGPPARTGDTVSVHYVGMNFSNGLEFDASWEGGVPFPVRIGETQVIEGWTRGLVGIREGGRRQLTIPPALGYGAEGFPPDIPPNETLIFVVDAVSVE
jgi:peptidylprolyl isomerase